MAETRNKRIRPQLAKEARENAKRYWAAKQAKAPEPSAKIGKLKLQLGPTPSKPGSRLKSKGK